MEFPWKVIPCFSVGCAYVLAARAASSSLLYLFGKVLVGDLGSYIFSFCPGIYGTTWILMQKITILYHPRCIE